MRTTLVRGIALALPTLLLPAGTASADGGGSPPVPPRAEKVARQTLGHDDGWAAHAGGTTGGSAATDENVHVVDDFTEFREVFAGGRDDDTARIVFVDGTIDANRDARGDRMTCEDYADPEYDLDAYLAEYAPENWGWDREPSGPLERARERSVDNQRERIQVEIGSNTTLIGLGDDARVLGANIMIESVSNVIVRNLSFENAYDCFPQWDPTDGSEGNWNAEWDNLSIRRSDHVWVDHNAFSDGDMPDSELPEYFGREYQMHDGLLDITHGTDLVTVSYNAFSEHDKTMLIGSTDSPRYDVGELRVTLHHNSWENVLQRAPRVRYGQVHVYNNHYVIPAAPEGEKGYYYSWGVGVESMIYAENNYFDLAESIDPATVIADWRGDAVHTEGSLVNGRSSHHEVDLLAAHNAAGDRRLDGDVGWTPWLYERVDPTRSVPATVGAKAGVGRVL